MKNDDTLNSKIIVFTGAGASAALNLPTTPEFAKRLEEKTTSESSLLAVYRTNISQTNGISEREVPIDSEYIRDWLENMKFMAKSIEDLSPVMRKIIHPKAPTANNVVLSVDSLLNAFDSQIIDTYGIQLNPELAFRQYWPLLQILNQHNIEVVPLFTTNYDLVFECMKDCKQSKWNVVTGMVLTGRGKSILDTKTFDEASGVPRLLIYKLHGSSDWWKNSETDEIEQVQARLRTSEEYKRSLIYPTRKKFGQIIENPFSFFYKRLKDNLTSEGIRACIAIGYSFRDRFINDIFVEALREGLKLIIIDKSMNQQQLMNEFKSYELDSSIIKDSIKIHNINFGNWHLQPDNRKRFSEIISSELSNL